MAKLSLRQKENIKALYHTGNYSKNQIAKKYKVDEKTVRRVIGSEQPKHGDLVEEAVKIEVRKKAELLPSEARAVDKVVKERTAIERMRDTIVDTAHKIAVHTTTASVRQLQKNSQSKNPTMDASELLTHNKVASEALKIATPKEEKPAVENHLNVAQLMSTEETNVEVTINDIDSASLAQKFKDRNLP